MSCIFTIITNLYFLGGEDGFKYADILEYSDSEGEENKWTKVGEMSQANSYAGVSVVSFDEYKDHCQ